MCGVHELVEMQFVEEVVCLLSVSIEDGRFLSLEWFFIYSNRIRVPWELWWRSRWWC
jgi:hypothetical protein